MNTREQLNQYLHGLEQRLKWLAVSKGAAIFAGVALGVTLAMVLLTNALAFSSGSLTIARIILFIALAVSVGFAIVLPLMRLNQRRAAGRAERSDARPARDRYAKNRRADTVRACRATQIDFCFRYLSRSRNRCARVADLRGPGLPGLRRIAAVGRIAQGR